MSLNINSIKNRLLVKYPLFGNIVANVIFEESYSERTAATDGGHVYYNPTFVMRLNEDEQLFLFAHEICHIAFNHIFRCENRNVKLWNIATDAVINALLIQDGLPLIKGGVNIPDSIAYNAEDLYCILLERHSMEKLNDDYSSDLGVSNNGISNSEGEESNDVGHDSHSLWEKAVENRKQNINNNTDSKKSSNESEIKRLSEQGEVGSFKENNKMKVQNLKKLRDSLIRQSCAGDNTQSNNIQISNIGVSKPLINWRTVLKKVVNYNVDWSYQNATIEYGVLTPHLEKKPRSETEIVLDTSGSIDENLLRNFLRECKNILSTSVIKVGCFDTRFYGFHEIRSESDIDKFPIIGGGGTNFDAATSAFSKHSENKIIFTDGNAAMPKKAVEAIWIVFGDKKINPRLGKVIYISDEDVRKMSDNIHNGKLK